MDFIRTAAMLLVLTFHFQAEFSKYYPQYYGFPFSDYMFNGVYLGAIGVSLFFILSGAALMISPKADAPGVYYKKRFFAIYPTFWLAWIAAWFFCLAFLDMWPYFSSIPRWSVVFSVLGMDGYLVSQIPNYYIVGEWFLGCMILLYLVAPMLRMAVERWPRVTIVCLGVGWIAANLWYHAELAVDCNFYMRAFEFVFGMYTMRYLKRCPWFVTVSSGVIFLLLLFLPVQWAHLYLIRFAAMGMSLFVFLRGCFENVDVTRIQGRLRKTAIQTINWLAKISYEVFLVHHILLTTVLGVLSTRIQQLSALQIVGIFVFYLCASFCGAVVLKWCSKWLVGLLQRGIQSARQRRIARAGNR